VAATPPAAAAHHRLSDAEIVDNIVILLVAGQDTSSSTLTKVFANLQEHPAVLQKLRDEQARVVAKHGGGITAGAMKDMQYAEAVIRWARAAHLCALLCAHRRCTVPGWLTCWLCVTTTTSLPSLLHRSRRETLRLDPVVAGLMRTAAREFELSGYTVPKDKLLLLPLKYLAAHDARWAAEQGALAPERFVPERMLTAAGKQVEPGDLLPFGYGPR
jgi:cytochrome P450